MRRKKKVKIVEKVGRKNEKRVKEGRIKNGEEEGKEKGGNMER